MNFTDSKLWQSSFAEYEGDPHSDERKLLRDAYLDLRKMTLKLVENIGADLRQFTVHDITHLDALWGIATEIVGPDFTLTPAEAFVLGGSFLLHDAGMCLAAYPRGLVDLEQNRLWPATLNRYAKDTAAPSDKEITATVADILRTEHAKRARELVSAEWRAAGDPYHLIEKVELRQKFGSSIGEVAASHWWSHDKLAHSLDRILPAPPPFPTEWRIDLLKVAAVLRVSDAAHIDERRAPGFVWALRSPLLGKLSELHWLFQNRLTQPERRGDALHYSTTSEFRRSEVEAWWLAYDALRIVHDELRLTDVLLADLRGESCRFAARRVANTESTATMINSIRVSGWLPVDTKIRISNVPALIKTIGGTGLYGDNTSVPLRELVQNAADAIRLKAALMPHFNIEDGKICVDVGEIDGKRYLRVTDNGVGMSEEIITGPFLDFGNSGWTSDPVFLDYPDVSPNSLGFIGKFGIGFFSVFMLGERIDVVTRRFDKAFHDTLVLSFSEGVYGRPILRMAEAHERLPEGGTSVMIWLNDEVEGPLGSADERVPFNLFCEAEFPTLDIALEVREGSKRKVVKPIDWETISPERLLARANGSLRIPEELKAFCSNMRIMYNENKEAVGRMFVAPRMFEMHLSSYGIDGVLVSRGIRVGTASGLYGILEGEIATADRFTAVPRIQGPALWGWLREQAQLLVQMNLPPKLQSKCASVIAALGGDFGELKAFLRGRSWLSRGELFGLFEGVDEIDIISDYALDNLFQMNPDAMLRDNVFATEASIPGVFHDRDLHDLDSDLRGDKSGSLESAVVEIASKVWGWEAELLSAHLTGVYKGRRAGGRWSKVPVAKTSNGDDIAIHARRIWKTMKPEDLVAFDELE